MQCVHMAPSVLFVPLLVAFVVEQVACHLIQQKLVA